MKLSALGIARVDHAADEASLNSSSQRPRLAAGLVFEKRPAQLQNQVKKLNLKIILN
jgi:hypothetical protein